MDEISNSAATTFVVEDPLPPTLVEAAEGEVLVAALLSATAV